MKLGSYCRCAICTTHPETAFWVIHTLQAPLSSNNSRSSQDLASIHPRTARAMHDMLCCDSPPLSTMHFPVQMQCLHF